MDSPSLLPHGLVKETEANVSKSFIDVETATLLHASSLGLFQKALSAGGRSEVHETWLWKKESSFHQGSKLLEIILSSISSF